MTDIKLKRGSGVPLTGDLAQGEPALDLTNKRLYTSTDGSDIVEVGINPSQLTVSGNFTSIGLDDTTTVSTALTLTTIDAGTGNQRGGAFINESATVGGASLTVGGGISATAFLGSGGSVSFYDTADNRSGFIAADIGSLRISSDDFSSAVGISNSGIAFSGTVTVDTDTLVVDVTNDRVGINNAAPSADLEVGNDHLVVDVAGNAVGIGTFPTLGANLHVKDNQGGNCVCYFEGGTQVVVLDLDSFHRIISNGTETNPGFGPKGVTIDLGGYYTFFRDRGTIQFPTRGSDPSGTVNEPLQEGEFYYNSTTNKLRFYNGSAWADV